MSKLIYHAVPNAAKPSVFDQAVLKVLAGRSIRMACPYLNLAYLQRLVESRDGDWTLVTDLAEFLRSNSLDERPRIVAYLQANLPRVRHISGLHAKVIASETSVMFGSANFTLSGMTRRTELSFQSEDATLVTEVRQWLASVWENAVKLDGIDIHGLLSSLPAPSTRGASEAAGLPPGLVVNTHLVPTMQRHPGRWTQTRYNNFVVEHHSDLYAFHRQLQDALADVIEYRGDGESEPTYHIVLRDTQDDILWVYADGRVYVRWAKLAKHGPDFVKAFQELWGDWVECMGPDRTPKNDGCFIRHAFDADLTCAIVENVRRFSIPPARS